jgi:hypothetical protein
VTPRSWRHQVTLWTANEGGEFDVRLLEECSWQPSEGAALTDYSIDDSGAVSERTKLYIKAGTEPLVIHAGKDYVAGGDLTGRSRPTPDAQRVLSVKDYSGFPLAHYEVSAG